MSLCAIHPNHSWSHLNHPAVLYQAPTTSQAQTPNRGRQEKVRRRASADRLGEPHPGGGWTSVLDNAGGDQPSWLARTERFPRHATFLLKLPQKNVTEGIVHPGAPLTFPRQQLGGPTRPGPTSTLGMSPAPKHLLQKPEHFLSPSRKPSFENKICLSTGTCLYPSSQCKHLAHC